MSAVGRAALLLALVTAVLAVVMALRSRRAGDPRTAGLMAAAERAVYCVFGLVTVGMATLGVALMTDSFGLVNVANYSNTALPWEYKLTGIWASQPGSLMLWAWLLSGFASAAVWINRRRNRELMPIVIAVMMTIAVFFTGLLSFVTSPFETVSTPVADGRGLNPLLQNPYMVIHPPILYLGYVALSVPFSFAMAALVTKRVDSVWITSVRRWTMLSWLCLGAGILLGARWAYEELGWGGYWAWDPVENAAFMPWLVATAFLHSVMVQERRAMLKVWNMVLIILTFSLAVFGTFLTRSGILSSVHAFGESTLGPYFLGFIALILVASLTLLVTRLPLLRSEGSLESYVSREAIFLYNNLLLVGLAFAIFWGTMFPILSEAARGRKITVGAGYYEQVAVPVGLALLLLTGIGPLIAWRKTTPRQLLRRFRVPLAVAAVAAPLLALLTPAWDRWPAGAACTIGAFVVACTVGEYWRGARVRHSAGGLSWPGAVYQLVARNRRRYGGYLVHLGIVVLFIGLAGSRAFSSEGSFTIKPGAQATVDGYTFVNEGFTRSLNDNVARVSVRLGVLHHGGRVATIQPGRALFFASQQPLTEVAIDSGPSRDVYAVLGGLSPTGTARLEVFINPLVMWIWVAGLIVVAGGLLAALPGGRPRPAPASVRAAQPSRPRPRARARA